MVFSKVHFRLYKLHSKFSKIFPTCLWKTELEMRMSKKFSKNFLRFYLYHNAPMQFNNENYIIGKPNSMALRWCQIAWKIFMQPLKNFPSLIRGCWVYAQFFHHTSKPAVNSWVAKKPHWQLEIVFNAFPVHSISSANSS